MVSEPYEPLSALGAALDAQSANADQQRLHNPFNLDRYVTSLQETGTTYVGHEMALDCVMQILATAGIPANRAWIEHGWLRVTS